MARVCISFTEYLQGRLLSGDALDVCDQVVDPLDVLVGGRTCEKPSRYDKGE